jgi:hypothetical protein
MPKPRKSCNRCYRLRLVCDHGRPNCGGCLRQDNCHYPASQPTVVAAETEEEKEEGEVGKVKEGVEAALEEDEEDEKDTQVCCKSHRS